MNSEYECNLNASFGLNFLTTIASEIRITKALWDVIREIIGTDPMIVAQGIVIDSTLSRASPHRVEFHPVMTGVFVCIFSDDGRGGQFHAN